MSSAVIMQGCYDNRSVTTSRFDTNCVAEQQIMARYSRSMLRGQQIMAMLEARGVTPAEIARAIEQPSSRVSELRHGRRKLTLDEACILAERYGLEDRPALPPLSEATARLMVLHVARSLGRRLSPEDARVSELAADFQALAEFAQLHDLTPEALIAFLVARHEGKPSRQ